MKFYVPQKAEKILFQGIIIAIVIIIADALDWCSALLGRLGPVGFGAVTLLCFCGVFIYSKAWKWFRLPVTTELDAAMMSGSAAAAMLFCYTLPLCWAGDRQFHVYKPVLALGTLLLLNAGLLFRRRALAWTKEKKTYNTYTLKELYQGDIADTGSIIYMEEEAVDYDLLNRGELIRTIRDVIRTCEPRRKYVISLSGAWGQGKTTIINNVKRELKDEENIVIIDSFDPWNYESKETLFSGMMDAIFRYAGVHYEINQIRRWKKQLGELIFDINAYTKGLKLFLRKEQETVSEIKALMNDFLGRYNKKIVFVLDNIERMDDKNILLLFKLVADVLDLDHVIYVLSYDAERIGTVLEKAGLKDRYLKKVIQMEFHVTPIDERRKREIFTICLKNLLKLYHVGEKQQEELLHLSDAFMKKITDVRDMKRFFNSVISACYGISNRWIRNLNAKDYVIMELLKRENPLIYHEIAENARFFVSADRTALFGHEMQIGNWKKEFNEEAKSYFDNLFSGSANGENKKWKDLLAEIFPYVENYVEGHDIIETQYGRNGRETYKSVIQNARIYSGKFFPQYFTLQSNDYMKIKLAVEEAVVSAGQGKEVQCQEKLAALCRQYPGSDQTEIIEMLQLFSQDFGETEWNILFGILYEMADELNDSISFFGYSARKRAYYLLSLGLDKISDSLFNRFLTGIQGQYDRLWALMQLLHHKSLNPNAEGESPRYEGRALALYNILRQMAEMVVAEGIDLYSDRYYRENNIWGWYQIVRYMPDLDIQKAFAPMLGEHSIYRFLWDMIQKSVGTEYGYTVNEEYLSVFTDRNSIAAILDTRVPRTESEAFVRKVWDGYLGRRNDGEDFGYDLATKFGVELRL